MKKRKKDEKSKGKIFVGSSREALDLGLAKSVGRIIRQAGMEPLLWDKIVQPGDILLERIERLPGEVHGAVLLATGDECCSRRNDKGEHRPVPNVVFEYGYLASRLTPKRVVLCTFDKVKIPSDLKGVTVVRAGPYKKKGSFRKGATEKLCGWIKHLPTLADHIPPISRVHGYSGRWEVRNNFTHWRGRKIKAGDIVYFAGTTFLLLSADCGAGYGCGTQTGKLYIRIGRYEAVHQISNRVHRATVAEDGTLNMHVEVLSRELIRNEGQPPKSEYGEKLFGSKEFDLELKVVPGQSKRLMGRHEYWVGNHLHQRAKEFYNYIGI